MMPMAQVLMGEKYEFDANLDFIFFDDGLDSNGSGGTGVDILRQ
jgi:hypothetical protein